MYIATVPNRSSPPAILLREGYREHGKVKTRTLANLSHWPPEKIESLRRLLRGESLVSPQQAFEIVRTRPHGHVAAVLGTLRRLGLENALASQPSRARDLCVALIVERILHPTSKLATARALDPETLNSTLGEILGVESADEEDLYEAMDWLLERQPAIEAKLARRHLEDGALALYDLTSVYLEGHHCPLAKLGYTATGPRGKPQIRLGLLTDVRGCPVAVEVLPGNVEDSKTLPGQVRKLREQLGLKEVVVVGDRGTVRSARIEDLRGIEGLSWITALRAPEIQGLVQQGALQLSLFDQKDLGEIVSPDYPGERLVVCRNPLLARERARKREELLAATERNLQKIVEATRRTKRPLRGRDRIGMRVGKVLGRYKMAKHFRLTLREKEFRFERKLETIQREAALDGIYVIRTSVSAQRLSAEETVRSYKSLSRVEWAFRTLKGVDLKVRPVYHWREGRVRAHVFLCMLAYYVEWHMRRALASMLFEEEDREGAEAHRPSGVAPAQRSPETKRKARTKRTAEGTPVHSFQSLMKDLATMAKNRMRAKKAAIPDWDQITTPTELQKRAFDLLQVSYRL